jgi:HlyD family secretion protein
VIDDPDAPAAKAPPESALQPPVTVPPSHTLVPIPQAVLEVVGRQKRQRMRRNLLALAVVVVAGAAGGLYWWHSHLGGLPAGIVSGNGRIEADEIDIATKFAGRVAEKFAEEGDLVTAGQVLARMDTRDLEASLAKAQASVEQARHSLDEARAGVEQQTTQVTFAQQEFDRTNNLAGRGYATNELLDQRRQALQAAQAALTATKARVRQAEQALDASTHDVELYQVNIADNTLVAPVSGRIQYRIANVGEVLPAGGKVYTLLDISNVYMNIYLPTTDAGQARVGSDARIVLDAYPNFAVPAHVSFIATQAQFTPKAVETKSERDKLMFRVKVRVDPEILRANAAEVRTGLPGVAYVRLDPNVAWPAELRGPASP